MPKTKKNNIKARNKRISKKSKKNMQGGFLSNEMQNLANNGFKQNQINKLSDKNITLGTVNQAIDYFNNNAHQIIVGIAENINVNADPLSNLSLSNDLSTNIKKPTPLNMNRLQISESQEIPENQNSNNIDISQNLVLTTNSIIDSTSNPIDSSLNSIDSSSNPIDAAPIVIGGKNNNKLKYNNSYKGGGVYGTGYGANCYDPNFSVYNTNLIKLFPYKP